MLYRNMRPTHACPNSSFLTSHFPLSTNISLSLLKTLTGSWTWSAVLCSGCHQDHWQDTAWCGEPPEGGSRGWDHETSWASQYHPTVSGRCYTVLSQVVVVGQNGDIPHSNICCLIPWKFMRNPTVQEVVLKSLVCTSTLGKYLLWSEPVAWPPTGSPVWALPVSKWAHTHWTIGEWMNLWTSECVSATIKLSVVRSMMLHLHFVEHCCWLITKLSLRNWGITSYMHAPYRDSYGFPMLISGH